MRTYKNTQRNAQQADIVEPRPMFSILSLPVSLPTPLKRTLTQLSFDSGYEAETDDNASTTSQDDGNDSDSDMSGSTDDSYTVRAVSPSRDHDFDMDESDETTDGDLTETERRQPRPLAREASVRSVSSLLFDGAEYEEDVAEGIIGVGVKDSWADALEAAKSAFTYSDPEEEGEVRDILFTDEESVEEVTTPKPTPVVVGTKRPAPSSSRPEPVAKRAKLTRTGSLCDH
ncbi:hypothetical protein C8Q75DRAFT_806187 [Abortiporus biennis]|nr:hypothetical protein C8Q75DRAFT_806187 [Abortiporus biennis]